MKLTILATLTMVLTMIYPTPAGASERSSGPNEKVVTNFETEASKREWRAVNDNVMGGISRGTASFEHGRLVFAGETRLENNGGFSSIRTIRKDWNLAGAEELSLRMRGTSTRKYIMILQTSARTWGMPVSYWNHFELDGDDWQTVRLSLADFYPTFHGRKLKGRKLDVAGIRSLGLMVYDKKAGPFRLEVDWIKAGSAAKLVSKKAAKASKAGKPNIPNIVELARGAGTFKTLLAAAEAAGLAETLTSGRFTVFAPSDDAFAALPEGTVATFLRPENREELRSILLYHVVPGSIRADKLIAKGQVETAQGDSLHVRFEGGRMKVGTASLVNNDLGFERRRSRDRLRSLAAEAVGGSGAARGRGGKGAPLFNDGHVDACAAIYEIAITALVRLDAPELSDAMRKVLSDALERGVKERDHRDAAWIYRSAIDTVWGAMIR